MHISVFLSRPVQCEQGSVCSGYTGLSVGLPCLVSCGAGQGLHSTAIFTMGTVWPVLFEHRTSDGKLGHHSLSSNEKAIVSQGYKMYLLIDINIMNINTVTCGQL